MRAPVSSRLKSGKSERLTKGARLGYLQNIKALPCLVSRLKRVPSYASTTLISMRKDGLGEKRKERRYTIFPFNFVSTKTTFNEKKWKNTWAYKNPETQQKREYPLKKKGLQPCVIVPIEQQHRDSKIYCTRKQVKQEISLFFLRKL